MAANPKSKQKNALSMSTLAFTSCFAVWTIFSIIGVQLKDDLGLNDTQFGLLVAMPILTGSLSRIFLGIWADQYGGRIVYVAVMVAAAFATFLLSEAETYGMMLLAALGVGLAGGSFAVGVAYVSKWYAKERQGTALGIFSVGNVGAAVTTVVAPFVLVAYGWETVAQVWAAALIVTAGIFWFATEDDPELQARRGRGEKPKGLIEQLKPLRHIQVWRFSLYYFFVFGAFVALTLWLPRYLVGVYGLDIKMAGILAAFFAVPAALFRAYGGRLSDRYGARTIMYLSFGVSVVCTFMLSYPNTDYVIHGIEGPIAFSTSLGLVPFVMLIFVLGFFMSLGMAAVFKHIPVYYSANVSAVGGLVGMVGGLGGFFLPVAFGAMSDLTGIWTSCFMLLFGLVVAAVSWMHVAIRRMERSQRRSSCASYPSCPRWRRFTTSRSIGARWVQHSWIGGRMTPNSGRKPGGLSRDATSGFRFRVCCWPLRYGSFGASSLRSFRLSDLTTARISCSGSRHCPVCPAQRCGFSMHSWCPSWGAGSGVRCQLRCY